VIYSLGDAYYAQAKVTKRVICVASVKQLYLGWNYKAVALAVA
jgi:hypothetical protein